jgi:hypothetical protein
MAAGLGQSLKPRRYIHPIAKDVVAVTDDVTDIDTGPEFDPPIYRYSRISLAHASGDIDGAAHSIGYAHKLHRHSIAGRFDDPTSMFGNFWVDQFFAVRCERMEHTLLIDAHEPDVA